MKGDDDLMKRVSAFLPILQAANEKVLLTNQTHTTLDANLVKYDDDDDDDDDNTVNEEQGHENTTTETNKTIIQLSLDLGAVKDNPLIELLANNDQDDGDDDTKKQSHDLDEELTTDKEHQTALPVVSELLRLTNNTKAPASKKQKRLIEEMP